MKKVCFVCLGNICRSPMAEFVMKDLSGTESWLIESRATSGWEHGNPIHHGTQSIFKSNNISYDRHKSSQQIRAKISMILMLLLVIHHISFPMVEMERVPSLFISCLLSRQKAKSTLFDYGYSIKMVYRRKGPQ